MNPIPGLYIVNYNSTHHHAFREINAAWIKEDFVMEKTDEEVLNDPEKYILNDGGIILMAMYNNEAAGTCALINEGDGIYELTKMGVYKQFRGLKIGFYLGKAIVEKAKELKAKKIILHSNTKGSAKAVELYRQLGFKEIPLGNAPWARANIKMELELQI
ncbi:MAG TPA: GNAT family N-acetyltransferase [Flavobacteriales bacterium]|nr:GNAT family N-acetyltransferase [Flavobacteriales bacterium]